MKAHGESGSRRSCAHARTPLALASAALTTQAAVDGRFTLGIGLSHVTMVESVYGASFDHPVRDLREFLTVLAPLLRGEPVDFSGESVRVGGQVYVKNATPCSILVGALGPDTRIRPVFARRWETTRVNAASFSTSANRSRTKGRTIARLS